MLICRVKQASLACSPPRMKTRTGWRRWYKYLSERIHVSEFWGRRGKFIILADSMLGVGEALHHTSVNVILCLTIFAGENLGQDAARAEEIFIEPTKCGAKVSAQVEK